LGFVCSYTASDYCFVSSAFRCPCWRWRKEYGGLNVDQAKRLKQLEDENSRLKKLVADLSLEKQVLSDLARGKL